MSKLKYGVVVAIISLFAISASAQPANCIKGVAVYVDDGDTAKIRTSNGQTMKVRFYGIDAPEKAWAGKWAAQPYSAQAKTFMQKLILNKSVCVALTGDKTKGRVVGEVFVGDVSTSDAIVRAGLAWWYKHYAENDIDLMVLQKQAKSNGIGIWSQSTPEAPWAYRYRHR